MIAHRDRRASLARTLDSLRSQTVAVDVCVADNASSDGSREMLSRDYPEVRVLELERNFGFGAAVNRAVESSESPLVALLNNDAVAEPDFAERLLEAHGGGAEPIVAACMLAADRSIDTLGVELDHYLSPSDCCHGLAAGSPQAASARPLGPSGGAALYERVVFLRLGGYDERIFAYLEDVDLAIRARLAGYGCALAANAVVHHEHSATLGAGSAAKNELMGFSQGFLDWRWGANLSASERAGAALIELVVYAGKAVIDRNLGALRGRLRAQRHLSRESRPAVEPTWGGLPLRHHSLPAALRPRSMRRR